MSFGTSVKSETLYHAATSCDLSAVTDMLTDGWPDGAVLNEALARACSSGSLPVAKHLLLHGAAIEPPKPLGQVPFFCACDAGHVAIASELLKRGAQIDRVCANGETALSRAASIGRSQVVELLLQHRASFDASGSGGEFGSMSPLQRAKDGISPDVQPTSPSHAGNWFECIRLLQAAEEARAIQQQRSSWRKVERAISVWPYARYLKAWYDKRKRENIMVAATAQQYDERSHFDHSSIYKPDGEDDEPAYTSEAQRRMSSSMAAPTVAAPATPNESPSKTFAAPVPPVLIALPPAPVTAPEPLKIDSPAEEQSLSGAHFGLPTAALKPTLKPSRALKPTEQGGPTSGADSSDSASHNAPAVPKLTSDLFRADADLLDRREDQELAPIEEGEEERVGDGEVDFDEVESARRPPSRPLGVAQLPLAELPTPGNFDEVLSEQEDPTARSAGGSSSGIE